MAIGKVSKTAKCAHCGTLFSQDKDNWRKANQIDYPAKFWEYSLSDEWRHMCKDGWRNGYWTWENFPGALVE